MAPNRKAPETLNLSTKSQRKERLDTIMAYGTVGAAIAAAAAAGASAWQVAISDGTAKRQLRAYITVVIDEGGMKADIDHVPLQLVNVGQTPAYNINITVDSYLKSGDSLSRPQEPPINSFPGSMSLGNGQKFPMKTRIIKNDGSYATFSEIISNLRADGGKEELIFKGEISYNDIFKYRHHDYYCFSVFPGGEKLGSIAPCPTQQGD